MTAVRGRTPYQRHAGHLRLSRRGGAWLAGGSWRSLLVIVGAALVLAGCGSSNGPSGDQNPPKGGEGGPGDPSEVVGGNSPALALPGDLTVEATSDDGAVVAYSASATDAEDGPVPVTCAPPSSSSFPIGTTTVTCSAVDKDGNKTSDSFTVTVVEITPPSSEVPPATTNGDSEDNPPTS
jgi:HYR domain